MISSGQMKGNRSVVGATIAVLTVLVLSCICSTAVAYDDVVADEDCCCAEEEEREAKSHCCCSSTIMDGMVGEGLSVRNGLADVLEEPSTWWSPQPIAIWRLVEQSVDQYRPLTALSHLSSGNPPDRSDAYLRHLILLI